jgi:hypothetical protein
MTLCATFRIEDIQVLITDCLITVDYRWFRPQDLNTVLPVIGKVRNYIGNQKEKAAHSLKQKTVFIRPDSVFGFAGKVQASSNFISKLRKDGKSPQDVANLVNNEISNPDISCISLNLLDEEKCHV